MIDKKFFATLTILYVQSDEVERNKYKLVFEELFEKVLIAKDGLEAIDIFNNTITNNTNIDIILSEVLLENSDGIEFLKHVKNINKNIPFILTSASTKKENLIASIKNGASNYLVKPIEKNQILVEIQKQCLKNKEHNNDSNHINELEEYLNSINKVAIVTIFDDKGKILYVNSFLSEVSKYLEEELLEQDYRFTYHSDISKSILEKQWLELQSTKNWKGKIKHLAKNNSVFYTNTTITPVLNNDKKKKFISINFLTTEEENKKRNYKKKVLYNLQETKKVYKVAQDKIDELKKEIAKYEDVTKLERDLESEKEKNIKYYEKIKDYESKISNIDKKYSQLTSGVNEKMHKISSITSKMVDIEFKARKKIKEIKEEILVREKLISKISNEIVQQSTRINDLEDVISHRENQIENNR